MKPTFKLVYHLTIDGDPHKLLEKLSLWIENKFYAGRVDNDSFVIKEPGRGLYEQLNDPTHINLTSTIEGDIQENGKIKLCAELNTGPKFQAYLIRIFIILFGIPLAVASFDWFYSPLTLLITTLAYLLNERLIRKRVKKRPRYFHLDH